MSKPADEAMNVQPGPLVEFLNTLPSPLTTTLVGLGPAISRIRYLAQLLTWKAPWEDCWLFLASWWAVCLIPELGLRYLAPLAIFVLFFRLRADPKAQQASPPVTEDTLQRAIADLTTVHSLLPSLPSLLAPVQPAATSIPPPPILLRSFVVLYVPYLALAYIVRIRILIALTGTLFLTWRSRWAAVLRGALWRSAHLRWAAYRAWSLLSGQPLPPVSFSPQARSEAQLASISSSSKLAQPKEKLPETSVRFLFTIYENQRWWMGLDWTAALLPGERPSWCSVSQQPAAPPSAFTLPAATTAYTPAPDGKRRVKRVARWRWEEEEWRVVVRREGTAGTSRVERPVPQAKDESAAVTGASRILKVAGKMRAGSVDFGERSAEGKSEGEGHSNGEHGANGGSSGDVPDAGDAEEVEEPCTDTDGWVYADNKWEGASGKGGMGKYTRFRKWTRVAVLTETVEIIGPGELGVRRDEFHPPVSPSGSASLTPSASQAAALSPQTPSKILAEGSTNGSEQSPSSYGGPPQESVGKDTASGSAATPVSSPAKEESRLRQRLKAAVLGTGDHS